MAEQKTREQERAEDAPKFAARERALAEAAVVAERDRELLERLAQ